MGKIELYILDELYGNELFMRDCYARQLEDIPPGEVRDAIVRIQKDEVRHCEEFEAILERLGGKPSKKRQHHRGWNESQLREMLEFDRRMEESLEIKYMESMEKLELEKDVSEGISRIMKDTQAHSEILKMILDGL